MMREIFTAVRVTLVLLVLVSGIYPSIVWIAGRAFFAGRANGSLIERDGRVLGSSLIGQPFTGDRYFHPRPSAAGRGYDATSSGGSNLGPTSRVLRERIAAEVRAFRAPVPADAVTASGSGLDPHISPANAVAQASRVARARGLEEERVLELVRVQVEERFLGLYGEPRVNVLLLNLALDEMMEGDGTISRDQRRAGASGSR